MITQFRRALFGHDDQIAPRQQSLVKAEKFPEQALDAVALNRFAQALGDHHSQAGMIGRAGGQAKAEVGRVESSAPGLGREKFPPPAEAVRLGEAGRALAGRGAAGRRLTGIARGAAQRSSLDLYADKRLRPLARRRCNTLRPPRVLMRLKKPCVRDRFNLLG